MGIVLHRFLSDGMNRLFRIPQKPKEAPTLCGVEVERAMGEVLGCTFGTFQRPVGWWGLPWQRVLNHGYARERLLLFSRKIPLARSTLPENGAKRKSPKSFESTNNSRLSDAADGGRTRTLSPERDFKSLVSANFTTAAQTRLTKPCCPLAWEGTGNNRCEVKCHPNDLPSLEVT